MIKRIFLLSLLLVTSQLSWSQASWEQFGQNRVQYRTFKWKYFDSTHFRTFFYDYGKANALYALNAAEQELSHIVYMMGGRLNKKLNIILYNTFGDYRQTNLGRKNDELNQANGGKLDVAGNYIVLYFDGDHQHLKRQIRAGIAKVIKDNMLFGDNIKDVVKNAVNMNLPEWYTLGYVSFIADNWTSRQEDDLINAMKRKEGRKFSDYAVSDPTLFGHSFWHFISDQYGDNTISNLLYLTRFRKSVNNAIEIIYKKPAKELFEEWANFYQPKTLKADSLDSLAGRTYYATIKGRPDAEYSQICASPTGREIAYVEKRNGQFTIYIQDTKYDKKYPIIEGGMRGLAELADPDYPMLCWSPSGKKMAALYQRKNVLNLRIFTTGKRIMEKRAIPRSKIDRITGMCFMGDESTLAVTAIKKGQSDLYTLSIANNRFNPITNDLFDDKDPRYVENGTESGIVFQSNRTSRFAGENAKSDAFNKSFNLFLYQPRSGTNLTPLSQTDGIILDGIQWGMEGYSYLEDQQGQLIRRLVKIEKNGTSLDTFKLEAAAPVPFVMRNQDYIHGSGKVFEVSKSKNDIVAYLSPFDALKSRDEKYRQSLDSIKKPSDSISQATTERMNEFVTPFDDEKDSTLFLDNIFSNTQKSGSRYQTFVAASEQRKAQNYHTTFYTDLIQSTLDNTLLFTRYQPISDQFSNVNVSGFLTSTLTDVMEDYKITGGARLGLDFRSIDYFLQYADYRRRADWGLLYFHTSTREETIAPFPYFSPYTVVGKRGMDFLQSNLTYPFDMMRSIRVQLGLRYDRTRYLAKEQYSIEIPNTQQLGMSSRIEYVYDNTINPMMNIWKGSRAKFFLECQYRFNSDVKGFTNIGYDARKYIGLYKNIILASRFAGAHSLSKSKILYYLGGVDNPLFAQFDNNTIVDGSDYAFQTLATNLRGYRQGARNGSSYMVWNEEIRVPVYSTFFKRQIKSGFIRNLQLITFLDAGIAIKGFFPTAENIVNEIEIRDAQSNVSVIIKKSMGLGYGLGLRSRFLGYFVRADFAWQPDGGRRPMLHLSLATDF